MKIKKLIIEVIRQLFPSAIAYTNFICMIAFLFATISSAQQKDTLLTLISAFATLYCLNEWDKRIKGEKHD